MSLGKDLVKLKQVKIETFPVSFFAHLTKLAYVE